MFKPKQLHTAICSAILAIPPMAIAQSQLEEITVTATRRATNVQDVPYNISAFDGSKLSAQGINDFSKIARSIPGLTLSDSGRSKNGINNGIVMRGLNVSGTGNEDFPSLTDPVVSVYMNETPVFANLELRDMDRVEVLRGPQATLYGSGSLAGTMKYIPAAPDMDEVSGSIKGKASVTDESDDYNTDIEATINVPLTDKLAFRGTVANLDNAGYIDSAYIEELDSNGQPTGNAIIKKDINDESVQMARGTLLFAPTDATDISFMYNYQKDEIGGSSATAAGLDGYESATKVLEEFEREVSLGSLIVKHDFGFAELTSATSLTTNEADSVHDQSYNYGYSGFWAYYAGVPREVVTGKKHYESKSTTQEFRLTSNGEGKLDWLVGAYYNDVEFDAESYDYIAGVDELYAMVNPQAPDLGYSNFLESEFEDRAVFGELTYHVSDAWQVTAGARYFDQKFFAAQSITLPPCGIFCGEGALGLSQASGKESFSDTLFKFNTSYDFSDSGKVYFTIAEGFRHGGANGVPVDNLSTPVVEGGVFAEHPDYLFFDPDKSVNYEIGFKGYLTDAARYSVAFFYVDWNDPILIVQTPNGGFPVMYNGDEAESKGVELELNTQLTESLAFNIGYTYTAAKLTKDFYIPNVSGGVESSTLGGQKGDDLPGIPTHTATASLSYTRALDMGADLTAHLGVSYKGDFVTGFAEPSSLAANSYDEIDSSTLADAYLALTFPKWSVSLYADNLTNADDITTSDGNGKYTGSKPGLQYAANLGDQEYRVRPRTIGISASYNF
ncbi:TonB-dependent receptor [Aestuariicella hydrocarbonica]|uniref:TonB-dependent receptor n=1 Tax=Pseudomaricurvus hydrocarbonicus TaxID=1470433 RepID=A0A9E5JWJ4_9GAMM|nr:TonB-dependent receptor [Aestuariicella hydrocarbonica]NHO65835.1 TonB-dependent receptor [Aestuariicella hydrocarbonica]